MQLRIEVTKLCLVLNIGMWAKNKNSRSSTCRKQHKSLLFCRKSFLNNAACLGSDFVLWTLMDSNNSKQTENEPPSIYQYFECILQLGMTLRIYLKPPAEMIRMKTSHSSQQDQKRVQVLILRPLGWETATTRWHLMLLFSRTVHPILLCMVEVFPIRQIR